MNISKTKTALLVGFILTLASCTKNPAGTGAGDHLQFERATLHVFNKQGSTASVCILANIPWSLSIEKPEPDWLTLSSAAGCGNDTLKITAIKDNNTNGYKFANIYATPVNNTSIQPVKLTVVQYDSSFKR